MKLIIAGSRNLFPSVKLIDQLFEEFCPGEKITEFVSGKAPGVDHCGEVWARYHGTKVKNFPANWDRYGGAAGPIRNVHMADYGDRLLLIWDGMSRGSASMKSEMSKQGKQVYECILRK